MIKAMESNHAAQLNAMQNRLIAMEINNANRFQPRQNNEKWQKRGPPQDQRPPNQLETTNMVNEEAPPFAELVRTFMKSLLAQYFVKLMSKDSLRQATMLEILEGMTLSTM
jgi:hypothetical protein